MEIKKGFKVINLERFETQEGHMIPIYKDWESDLHDGHVPEMVYVTTLKPGTSKEIIYHKERTSFLTCIQGKVSIELFSENKVSKVFLNNSQGNNGKIIMISPKIPFKINNEDENLGIVVNCPTHAWKPNSKEMIKFKDWEDFKKWEG